MNSASGPTGSYRVVQLHPGLRCNLRCRHCYSSSGPAARGMLPAGKLCGLLDVLQAEGFGGVGISGGEPLLYPGLAAVLAHARSLGLVRTVTTNGMLLDEARATELAGLADLVAVSLDGLPESHNRTRGHPRAFEIMYGRLEHLRRAGVPFGFIFTLTMSNLDELPGVTDLAIAAGAGLLQVHPLEEVGRAVTGKAGQAPDDLELAHAFVEVARLRKLHRERIELQLDVADLAVLRDEPERGFAGPVAIPEGLDAEALPLADLVSPLVVEADGAIVPLQYGFGRAHQVAHLYGPDLRAQFGSWRRAGWPRFRQLSRRVHAELTAPGAHEHPFVNWYGAMLQASRAPAPAARKAPVAPASELVPA